MVVVNDTSWCFRQLSQLSLFTAPCYGHLQRHLQTTVMHKRILPGDNCPFGTDTDQYPSTAEIAANAPRYRRKSSTLFDGIHDVPEDGNRAPAQLYSTMSGRLFHSGRIAIIMVGLPARGKT